ncbi:MAG: hypothetical protein Q9160_000973 [Pyrenula sp. 1 TL-2023]
MSLPGDITVSKQPADANPREVASQLPGNIPTVTLDSLPPTTAIIEEPLGLGHELAGKDPYIYSNIVSKLGLTALQAPTSMAAEAQESTDKDPSPLPPSHLSPYPHATLTHADASSHTTTPPSNPPTHTSTPSPHATTATVNITSVISATAWVNATTLLTSTRTADPSLTPANPLRIHHEKTKRIPVWAIALTSTVLSLLFLAVIIMLGYRGIRKWKRRLRDQYAREAWAQTQKLYHREPYPYLNTIGISTSDLQTPPKVYTPPPSYPGRLERRGARFNPLGNVRGHTTSDEVNNPLAFISRTATRESDSRSAPAALGIGSRHSFETFSSDDCGVTVGSQGARLGTQRGFSSP